MVLIINHFKTNTMYYKITNKESEVYKKLHEMRTNELRMDAENLKAVQQLTELPWVHFLCQKGQRNMHRTTEYIGFEFLEPAKVDFKLWKRDTEHPEVFVPNRRSKKGREMETKLHLIGRNGNYFEIPLRILGIKETGRRFQLPYVEIHGDTIILNVDDKHEPIDKENVIEITRREFIAIENSMFTFDKP